ncbi:hypothetical protein LUZ60_008763 [Juncus effusus]|nr:hypothetical protein LUZ60_008763 [Juncus effusus]
MAQARDLSSQSSSSAPAEANNAMAALYVGDLDLGVTESQLFEMFCQVGAVVSVRVCRDARTRDSLGYAYVNFSEASDAAKAIETLNFTPINGKPIRVMYSNRDASTRIITEANLFVKNLDKSISNVQLYKTFSPFGTILSCKIATEPTGQSKGYGFVQFDCVESAQNAIQSLNGTLLNDKTLFVGPFLPKVDRASSPVSNNDVTKFNSVFVKNFSESTSEDNLREIFGEFGKITSVVVMREQDGKSKCFGFVNFENSDDALKAVEGLNGKSFEGKEWFVGKAMKKSEREREFRERVNVNVNLQDVSKMNSNLYLKNLDDGICDEKLREIFSEFGAIASCKIMKDETGRSKGTGFVNFESYDDAEKALEEMNGKLVGTKPLYIAFAERKEDRRARLQERFSAPVGVSPHPLSPHMPMFQHMSGQFFYGQHPAFMPQQGGYGYQLPAMRAGNPPMSPYVMPMSPQQSPRGPRGRRPANFNNNNNNNNNNGFGSVARMNYNNNQGPMTPNQNYGSRGNNSRYGNGNGNGNGNGRGMRGRESPRNETLASALAKSSPEQQRLMLGDNLFPLVDSLEPEFAAKITGMILEMDQNEILHLIESPDDLKAKVDEAKSVLRNHHVVPSDQFSSLSLNGNAIDAI